MQKNKTQQFAKFFIKDSKSKSPGSHTEKPGIKELNFSTAS